MVQPRQMLEFAIMTYRAMPWPALEQRWRWLDELGYDCLYSGDHLWSTAGDTTAARPRYEAWLLAAGTAASTPRARIGILVSAMLMRNPVLVAKQAITLDHLTGGRFRLGLGAGGNPRDEAIAGVRTPSDRPAQFAEYVQLVDALLREHALDFDGAFYSSHGWVRSPGPVQQPRPHLVVAAHVPRTLDIAARFADTWSSYGTLMSRIRGLGALSADEALALTAERAGRLDEYASAAGRDPASIRRSFLAGFTADRPWDSIDAFEDFVGRYAAIGIDEFVFPDPSPEDVPRDRFELISRDVIPRLRRGI